MEVEIVYVQVVWCAWHLHHVAVDEKGEEYNITKPLISSKVHGE